MLAKDTDAADRRLAFLRILRQLLELDAQFVLSPTQQASRFLLDAYLSILNARRAAFCSMMSINEVSNAQC
jgi:hypothetical protein